MKKEIKKSKKNSPKRKSVVKKDIKKSVVKSVKKSVSKKSVLKKDVNKKVNKNKNKEEDFMVKDEIMTIRNNYYINTNYVSKNKNNQDFENKVFYKDSRDMKEVPSNSVQLVVTSPPYFNIKDYSKDGYQKEIKTQKQKGQIGDVADYKNYIKEMLLVWKECFRVLKPNGKLIINTPLMPMIKKQFTSHYNRHIFHIDADIQNSILENIKDIYLLDVYIWNRTNPTKKLMFGSYPYPRNFYAQNTCEFISVYVKDGAPENGIDKKIKDLSKLTEKEWIEYTKQIWNIPIPNKNDKAFGIHSAIMPEEIVERCIKLFTFKDEIVLDPFTGSGTTLKVAKELERKYIGYEISEHYKGVIDDKLGFNSLFK